MRSAIIAAAALLAATGTTVWAQAQSEPRLEIAEAAGIGKHVVDAKGRAVYLFTADKKGGQASTCTGKCAEAWPPVTTQGQPELGSGLDQARVGTIQRQDGATQLTYDGMPLYYFAQDLQSGQTLGQDKKGFGGEWYLIKPDGSPVKSEQRAQGRDE